MWYFSKFNKIKIFNLQAIWKKIFLTRAPLGRKREKRKTKADCVGAFTSQGQPLSLLPSSPQPLPFFDFMILLKALHRPEFSLPYTLQRSGDQLFHLLCLLAHVAKLK